MPSRPLGWGCCAGSLLPLFLPRFADQGWIARVIAHNASAKQSMLRIRHVTAIWPGCGVWGKFAKASTPPAIAGLLQGEGVAAMDVRESLEPETRRQAAHVKARVKDSAV